MIFGTDYLHYDLSNIGPKETIKVKLETQAYVRLLDEHNYYKYINSQQYQYYGGFITSSPYNIKPPYNSNWHLIIDLGGGQGHLSAQVQIIR